MYEDEYVLKNANVAVEFGFYRNLAQSDFKYMLGHVKKANGQEVPAIWTDDGHCHYVGGVTTDSVRMMYNLVHVGDELQDLERQLDALWPHIDLKYNYAVISKWGVPVFFSAKPAFNYKENVWFRRNGGDERCDAACFHIETKLPVKNTLVVRPLSKEEEIEYCYPNG